MRGEVITDRLFDSADADIKTDATYLILLRREREIASNLRKTLAEREQRIHELQKSQLDAKIKAEQDKQSKRTLETTLSRMQNGINDGKILINSVLQELGHPTATVTSDLEDNAMNSTTLHTMIKSLKHVIGMKLEELRDEHNLLMTNRKDQINELNSALGRAKKEANNFKSELSQAMKEIGKLNETITVLDGQIEEGKTNLSNQLRKMADERRQLEELQRRQNEIDEAHRVDEAHRLSFRHGSEADKEHRSSAISAVKDITPDDVAVSGERVIPESNNKSRVKAPDTHDSATVKKKSSAKDISRKGGSEGGSEEVAARKKAKSDKSKKAVFETPVSEALAS